MIRLVFTHPRSRGGMIEWRPKPPVPRRRWSLWFVILAAADLVFYVLLTPLWLGLRGAAWVAEWQARRARGAADGQ